MGSRSRKDAAELEPYMSRADPRRPTPTPMSPSGCLVFFPSTRTISIIILHELCVYKEGLLPALGERRFALLPLALTSLQSVGNYLGSLSVTTKVSAPSLDQSPSFYFRGPS